MPIIPIVISAIKYIFFSNWIASRYMNYQNDYEFYMNVKNIISVVSNLSNNKTKNINEQQNRPFKHEKYVHGWVKEMLKIYISKSSLVML